MTHYKRVLFDGKYRIAWIGNIAIAMSQLFYTIFYGGGPDQTLSGEIGRRLSQSRDLDPFLTAVKWAGDRTLGSSHWWLSMERDKHYSDLRFKHKYGFWPED